MKRLTAAAALLVLAAGLSGCTQERLTVADTCDEIRAVMADAQAAGADSGNEEAAKDAGEAFRDLADRGAEPLEDPLDALGKAFKDADFESEMPAEIEAAGNQIGETCEF